MVRFPLLLSVAGCSAFDATSTKEPTTQDQETDTGGTADTGDTGDSAPPVDADGDGSFSDEDCDDTDATSFPGAPELCDGKDNDCGGSIDNEGDSDGDALLDCEDYCPVYAEPMAAGDGRIHDPLGSLQVAIDTAAASGCNEVRAYEGTYEEHLDWNGSAVNAESLGGAASTIIQGDGTATVVDFHNGEAADARIYDFTITGGGGLEGGGVRARDASPTIEFNVIAGNVLAEGGVGGGIRTYNSSPAILDNVIMENDACMYGPETGCDGGAIGVRGGAPTIVGNWMERNTAGDGGAIWTAYNDGVIANNVIVGNEADDSALADGGEEQKDGQGGGIDVQVGGPGAGTTVTNNVIADNWASTIGGGLVVYEYQSANPGVTVANNVIAFNEVASSQGWGAGFAQWGGTVPDVYNNAIYGNAGVGAYAAQDPSTFAFTYNDVYGNADDWGGALSLAGTGNVSADPLFTAASDDGDFLNDNFRLGSGSPLLDAGDPAATDADGSRSDIGAYGGPAGSW